MARDFRIPGAYNTLLALALTLGPIGWLLLDPDGQRRTDLALMALLGRPPFDAALDSFAPTLDEQRLRQAFPALDLQCVVHETPFGDRVCTSAIGSFNGFPARAVALYFRGESLSAAKVVFPPAYKGPIRDWVERRPGRRHDGNGPAVARVEAEAESWPVARGVLVMQSGETGSASESALFWVVGTSLP